MAQPIDLNSDPNSQASGSSHSAQLSVKAFYQKAIAAFNAQDYEQALARFQRLEQLPPTSPYYLKALMGRVRVHQRLGQGNQVKRLCHQLLNSPSPQAQTWANQVLSQLSEQAAIASTPDLEPQTTAARADLSGFVPLENSKILPQRTPLPGSQSIPPTDPDQNIIQETTVQETADVLAQDTPETKSRSLFHYQQLNQQPDLEHRDAQVTQASPTPSETSSSSTSPIESSVPEPVAPPPRRKQAPQRQQPLPKRSLALWLGQGLTAIALVWITNWAFHFTLRTVDGLLRWVRWPVQLGLPGASQTYTVWVVIGLVLLALASPWLTDLALATWYRQRQLSLRQLQTYSPGTLRLLRQVCRQQGWQMPELRLIADSAPLCFSYGWLPRYTRIVVSQGLLEQASEQALTTFYSYELTRMVNGSLPVLSAVGLPLLLLHTGYRRLAQGADTLTHPLIRGLLGSGATLLYGLFWLLRQVVLWLSRLCCRWGDRRVVALTQHPDQMTDVLVDVTAAIATHLQQHGTLHPLHTSLEVLMPVSSRQAIAPGGLLAASGSDRAAILSTLLALDGLNPYRQWLRVNASHEPLGERLLGLNQQALLRGQPSLTLEPEAAQPAPRSTATVSMPLLLLQKGPLVGLAAGGGLAMSLWFVGGVVNGLGWQRLSWLYQDPSILIGGLWLGLGLGLLLRINVLFPEPSNRPVGDPSGDTVATLLLHSSPLPVQGQPVSLQGKLRGLAGAGNWGCQELYLDDSSGLVKLIDPIPLGSLQGLLQPQTHPFNWVGRRVTVTGWSRYSGGMLWIDINQVKLDQRHSFSTYGPAWATMISLISSLIGIWTIFRGG